MRRAVISCAKLEIFFFNSFVLALDAWVRLAKVLCSVVMLLLSSFLYVFAAAWYWMPQLFPDWRRTMYASVKWFLNSALFLFSVENACYSNADTNELNKNISSMSQGITSLRTTVGQQAQKLANMATTPLVSNPAWSAPPTWSAAPPVPTNLYLNPGTTNPYTPPQTENCAPTFTTPTTAGIPPSAHTGGEYGRGGRHGGRGWGGAQLNKNQSVYGREPPTTGGDTSGGVSHNNPQHNNKWFANRNMCYSCGWDVSYWQTSKTCPTGCRNAHHQEGCDSGNAQAYINAGHNVRLKGKEKTVYPINLHEGRC